MYNKNVGKTSALPTQRNIKLKGGDEQYKSQKTDFNKKFLLSKFILTSRALFFLLFQLAA